MTEPGNVDDLVVARAIAGDREVLDGILTALQAPVYRYSTQRETAEDALQEAAVSNLQEDCLAAGSRTSPSVGISHCRPGVFPAITLKKRRGEEMLDLDTLEAGRRQGPPAGMGAPSSGVTGLTVRNGAATNLRSRCPRLS